MTSAAVAVVFCLFSFPNPTAVISTEAAHSFIVGRAAEKPASLGSRYDSGPKASSRCRRFLLAIAKILIYKKAPDTKLHDTNLPGDFKLCSSGYRYKHPQI
jgi:hypothetical protein